MNGAALLSFLLALPANELVMPVLLMTITGGTALGGSCLPEPRESCSWLPDGPGRRPCAPWCLSFSLALQHHLITIQKETGSFRWTAPGLPPAYGVRRSPVYAAASALQLV